MLAGTGTLSWSPLMDDPDKRAEHEANVAACRARGLLTLKPFKGALRGSLAAVGGSPDVSHYGHSIVSHDDVWASGSAFQWMRTSWTGRLGFFTVDRHPLLAEQCKGANYAIVASCCSPALFDALDRDGIYTRTFDLIGNPEPNHGSTSITAVPYVAKAMNYREVVFYGCESSYSVEMGHTHAYADENENRVNNLLTVATWGERGMVKFLTNPDFLIQAIFLARVIRAEPQRFKAVGGGLLAALIENPEHAIVGLVPGWSNLKDSIGALK